MVKHALVKILLLSMFWALYPLMGQTTEYKLKAVFLERFTRFIEWPAPNTRFSDTTKSFIITVIGDNPFGSALDDLYSSTKIKNKKVKIKYITKISEIDSTNILFISDSKEKSLDAILDYTRGKPILTVSDHDGFAEKGVIINFYIANNKIRFEINENSLIQSKLYMSYLLLNVANIVKGKEVGQ
jgi:hypothetical protein